MNVLKELFNRDISAIKSHIELIKNDENCNDYDRHINLGALYGELHDAFTNKKDFDEQEAKEIHDNAKAHKLAAEDLWKKNREINKIEAEIQKRRKANNSKEVENYIALIHLYKRLIALNSRNENYKVELSRLEKLRLQTELQEQITELEKVDNKPGLLIAYRALQKTYITPEYQARYTPIIELLAQEIAEEARQRDEELMHISSYNETQINIEFLKFECSDITAQEIQLQLINLLEKCVIHGKKIPAYASKIEADKKRIMDLRADSLAQIETENEQATQKEQTLKAQYQKLQAEKLVLASNKSLPEIKRKMQLACLFDSSAEVWYELPRFANAEDDWKKARSLRYEALALAQARATKDPVAEKELFALLAPKVD